MRHSNRQSQQSITNREPIWLDSFAVCVAFAGLVLSNSLRDHGDRYHFGDDAKELFWESKESHG